MVFSFTKEWKKYFETSFTDIFLGGNCDFRSHIKLSISWTKTKIMLLLSINPF